MRIKHLILTTMAAGSLIGVAAPAASADTTGQSAVSANWSGYVAQTNSGQGFSSVSGSWVQPSTNCSAGQGDSSFWVGLGGSGQQSQALEQTGTEADCSGSSSTASNYAWYELVPSAPVQLGLKISPGDHISAKVSVSGTSVTVSLADTTTGQSTTKTLQMNGPDVSSAEWIAEAPSSCDQMGNCTPVTLADFGKVDFTSATATAGGHTGTISDSDWTAEPVTLSGGSGGYSQFVSSSDSGSAQPSSLSSDGSAFSVSYGSGDGSTAGSSGDGSGGYGYGSGSGGAGSGGYGSSGYGSGDGYGGGYGYGDGSGYGGGYGYGGGGGYVYVLPY